MRKDSPSWTVTNSSITEKSTVRGMRSSPIPSTLYGTAATRCPVRANGARMDPSGSTATTRVEGDRALKNLPIPLTVPPVPMLATTASTRPSRASRISGPVVSKCAWGLASFSYWFG
jgi:hypothetical protein